MPRTGREWFRDIELRVARLERHKHGVSGILAVNPVDASIADEEERQNYLDSTAAEDRLPFDGSLLSSGSDESVEYGEISVAIQNKAGGGGGSSGSGITHLASAATAVASGSTATNGEINLLTVALPISATKVGTRLRLMGFSTVVPNADAMFSELRIKIGVGAITGGTQVGGAYIDHRVSGRVVSGTVLAEYVWKETDPLDVDTVNVVLVLYSNLGTARTAAVDIRPTSLMVDQIGS